MDAQAQSSPEPVRSGNPKAFLIVGRATLTLIAVQFGLAGYGAFAALDGGDLKNGAWAPHTMLGYLIALLLVVEAVLAATQRLGTTAVQWMVLVALLAAVGQPLLGVLGHSAGAWFGFLHALNGVTIAAVLGIVTAQVGRASASPS